MDNQDIVSFNYARRFGVEIETNAFDKRDFVKFPLVDGELPKGIEYIGDLLSKNFKIPVLINRWHFTHNNDSWVLKPDSSCGIEICSPVTKRWSGLRSICEAIEVLNNDKHVSIDDRCSFHVHVEVNDCTMEQLAAILIYWIKSEAVFLDSVPERRKISRYCQAIGETNIFRHNDSNCSPDDFIKILGKQKYTSINTFHFAHGRRRTIEFRIIGNEGCKNPYLVKNWIRLLIHFVEKTKNMPLPPYYMPGNAWSGLCWVDLDEVMTLLEFDGSRQLSKGMEQTRNWFLSSIHTNLTTGCTGVWSSKAREITKKQVDDWISKLGIELMTETNNPEVIYGEENK